jgi:WD40 repeat protein
VPNPSVTNPSVPGPPARTLRQWSAPEGGAITSMDFVHGIGYDWLAVADQSGELHLIRVDCKDVARLSDGMVAYGLADVPRRTHSPGLAAVGQRILTFDLESQTNKASARSRRHAGQRHGTPLEPALYSETTSLSGDGECLFPPTELPGLTTALAVTALVDNDLTVIAVGGKDRDRTADVYLYRGDTGEQFRHLKDEEGSGAVRAIEALLLERHLVVMHDRGVSIWDISHCAEREPCRLRQFGRGDTRAMTVFYDPQGRPRVATASTHGIEIWDPGREGSEHPLGCFARVINATAIAAVASEDSDPQLAVADADDHSVSLWSTTTEERVSEDGFPNKPSATIRCLATSPAGDGSTLLAAADDDGQVVVWQLPKVKSTTRPYGRHDRWVNALVAVAAGDFGFASASDDGTVGLWQPEPGFDPKFLSGSSHAAVQALAVPHEPDLLISGDEAGHITAWKISGRNLLEEKDIGVPVRALATIHDRDGREYVVAAGARASLMVPHMSAFSGAEQVTFGYPESAAPTLVRALAVGEADKRELLAAGDSHGRVTVWQASTGEQLWTSADQHQGQVRTLAWIPTVEGVRLASGGSDGNICLWLPEGGIPKRFEGHRGPVAALAAFPTANQQVPTSERGVHLFASGGADGTICIWNPDAPGGSPEVLRQAHPGWVRALLPLEHGGTLHVVSGGDDGSVRQWVVADGKPQSTRHEGGLPGFGDRPARADLLSRKKFQEVLVALLRLTPHPPSPPRQQAAPPADSEESEEKVRATGPRVVAVQGPWGAGKTSLMRFIYKELRKNDHTISDWHTGLVGPEPDGQPQPAGNQTPAKDDHTTFTAHEAARLARQGPAPQSKPGEVLPLRILPVWFNPWAHKSAEEVWAGLTEKIIEAARQVLGNTDAEWQRYWFTRNLERLDGGEIRRVLHQRMFWQPLLSTPLLAPVIAAAVAFGVKWPATGLYIVAAGLVAAFIAMTVTWWRGPARAYLPADIMNGPVLSGFQANSAPFAPAPSTDDVLLHDPLYHARSGYLYLAQRDIDDLADELARRRYMLIVFIDDLDRCPPETVAEVFEAVNIFLAENFANAKFVVGLDPSVVAHDLAVVFHAQQSRMRDDPDDPDLGWSFLRKLCQLPLTLPEIREAHTARLMRLHSEEEEQRSDPADSHPSINSATIAASGSKAGTKPEGRDGALSEATESSDSQPVADDNLGGGALSQSTPAPAAGSDKLLFEADPVIRDHLRALMTLRPHQSVRETKRLLTLWAFYLELLRKLLPEDRTSSAQFGRDVLTLAEILTRWPALVPKLGPASSPESGLWELIKAAKPTTASAEASRWQETLHSLGLDRDEFRAACENLRELLHLYGNDDVAYYAECAL